MTPVRIHLISTASVPTGFPKFTIMGLRSAARIIDYVE
jgi:hypothetical protein